MPDLTQTITGPILSPRPNGSVEFFENGALACDASGKITYIGERADLPPQPSHYRSARGLVIPPMFDAHIHIPQHPIRGRFMEAVGEKPPQGRLIAGLNRNVFPAEAKC